MAEIGKKDKITLKGLSVIVDSKLYFFPNLQIFCIIRENSTVIASLTTDLSETAYFWKERQFFVVGN